MAEPEPSADAACRAIEELKRTLEEAALDAAGAEALARRLAVEHPAFADAASTLAAEWVALHAAGEASAAADGVGRAQAQTESLLHDARATRPAP